MSAASFPTPYDPRPLAALIRDPVAVILLCSEDHEAAHLAVAAFETAVFPPGSPENDLFQAVCDTSWEGAILSVAVFPGEHLPRLEEFLRSRGLCLLDGTPYTLAAAGRPPSSYDVDRTLGSLLGISVGGRVRTVSRGAAFNVPITVSVRSRGE